jgi:hypothetical protein
LDKLKTNKKDAKMKTMKSTIATLAAATLFFTGSLFAMEFNFEEEAYINDIPFNTEEVYFLLNMESSSYDFEEESYINDIPFNTACITADCRFEKALEVNYQFEDESFVNDIPFNTESMLAEHEYMEAVSITFEFEDEVYIDDIPFDTYAVTTTYNCNHYAYTR